MSDLDSFLSSKKGKKEKISETPLKIRKEKPKIIERGKYPFTLEQLNKEDLISLLESLVIEIPGFASNLAWTRKKILTQNSHIHPEELSNKLEIPLLEAYMILKQLRTESEE